MLVILWNQIWPLLKFFEQLKMRVTKKIEEATVKRHVTSRLNSCISHSHDLKYRASVFTNVD